MAGEEVTLKEYLENCLANLENKLDYQAKYIEQHFALNELAIKKAEESMLTRLENMNQFRDQIREERANFASKDLLDSRLKPLEEAKAFSSGRMWMVMAIFAAVPTILALIALFGR